MKRYTIVFLLVTLVLVACGPGSNRFKIEGKFTNLNQGELYVYSPDGGISGIDTIKVQDGHFAYDIPLEDTATFVIVFPNFSEQPVFARPGESAELKADASRLKEMEITGNDDNELMTKFRHRTAHASPSETNKAVDDFINDNPISPACIYLINHYYINSSSPNYTKALESINKLIKKQPGNGRLIQEKQQLLSLTSTGIGAQLPDFTAIDMNNNAVSNNSLRGHYAVINFWASWSFTSVTILNQLKSLKYKYGNRLSVLQVSLDVSKNSCKSSFGNDFTTSTCICDEQAWDGKLVKTMGVGTIPYYIIIDANGKIIDKGTNEITLNNKIESLLK